MGPLSISVEISSDGGVKARSWRDGAAKSGQQRVDLTGLDGRVLRVFERWLMDQDRVWDREDIRVFGQLLHRRLFPDAVWTWIEEQIDERGDDLVRLQLAFPVDAASSRLASLPWEFLCAPDRAGQDGRFLVLTPGLMLSRSVPPGTPERASVDMDEVRILPVVGDAHNDWLGPVDYQPVLDAITTAGERRDFTVLGAAVEVTEDELAKAIADQRPHVVHYVGHGRFSAQTAKGAVALRAAEGGTAWVDEDDLAERLCTDDWAPTVVVLHACEGGRTDYEYRHAGLAPGLVRQGVQCVVAMQYPVTNEMAIEFSTALYEALADQQYLDEAVQTARARIWQATKDARLLGVPMVYQRSAAPLLGKPRAKVAGG
jgi:CHAT domain